MRAGREILKGRAVVLWDDGRDAQHAHASVQIQPCQAGGHRMGDWPLTGRLAAMTPRGREFSGKFPTVVPGGLV